MNRRGVPRRLPAVGLLVVLPLLQAFAPAPAGPPPGWRGRIATISVPEAQGVEIPQVALPDTVMPGCINEAIVAAMLTQPADLDSSLNRDPVQALHRPWAACCATEDGQAKPGQGLPRPAIRCCTTMDAC